MTSPAQGIGRSECYAMPENFAPTAASNTLQSPFEQEVAARFGLVPHFFQTAKAAPGLIQELWGFAKSGYLDNPLPSLFKERLFVHLSRFCEVRYCIVRHVGFLIGHGHPAGDPHAVPNTVEQAVALLSKPAVLAEEELARVYLRLKACDLREMPAMDTEEEADVFAAASVMFVSPARSSQAAGALRQAVGGANFEIITAFLAFIRTAHYWTLTHPELAFESDMVALLGAQAQLSKLLLDGSDAAKSSLGNELHQELVALRNEHDDREALRKALAELEVGQRHQQLLINELNHRVKNTLAIVQSLAYQTLRGANVEPSVREAFTGRLVALAEAHDLLNAENWENARLQDVLLQALKAQAPELVMRVRFDGPSVRLSPKQALSIAMATHELTTNAIKYGALSIEQGRVQVCWSVADIAGEPWLELSWAEVQGPEIHATRPPGFGTRLIQRGLAAELGGEATLTFQTDGVRCVIRAPLIQEQ